MNEISQIGLSEVIIAGISSLTTLLLAWLKIKHSKGKQEKEEKEIQNKAETLIENLHAEKIIFIRKGKKEFEIQAGIQNEKVFPVKDKVGNQMGELKIVFSNKKELSLEDEGLIIDYLKLFWKKSTR